MAGGQGIFLGYRRDDSASDAGRIFDHLERRFGEGRVFKDVDSIPRGARFRVYVAEIISGCRVFLVLIGSRWLSVTDRDGRRRLDDPDDLVRVEIETALARPGLLVIPVLVGDAEMPSADSLPASMRALVEINCARLRRDPDFKVDMARLVRDLEEGHQDAVAAPPPKPRAKKSAARARTKPVADQVDDAERLAHVTQLIETFYQPIRTRLQLDDAVWERILDLGHKPGTPKHAIAAAIERDQIMPNHDALVATIHEWRHLLDDDDVDVSRVIDRYLSHVSVYKAIRATGDAQSFPLAEDAPWPKEFLALVEKRLGQLKAERRALAARG